jgi:hypothetical protein
MGPFCRNLNSRRSEIKIILLQSEALRGFESPVFTFSSFHSYILIRVIYPFIIKYKLLSELRILYFPITSWRLWQRSQLYWSLWFVYQVKECVKIPFLFSFYLVWKLRFFLFLRYVVMQGFAIEMQENFRFVLYWTSGIWYNIGGSFCVLVHTT